MNATAKTPCQRCGELVPNDALPLHIARHSTGQLKTLPIGEVFQRVMSPDPETLPRLPLSILLEAVMSGATLVLAGPGSIAPAPQAENTFSASIESQSGARHASSSGETLAHVIHDLASKWVLL